MGLGVNFSTLPQQLNFQSLITRFLSSIMIFLNIFGKFLIIKKKGVEIKVNWPNKKKEI